VNVHNAYYKKVPKKDVFGGRLLSYHCTYHDFWQCIVI